MSIRFLGTLIAVGSLVVSLFTTGKPADQVPDRTVSFSKIRVGECEGTYNPNVGPGHPTNKNNCKKAVENGEGCFKAGKECDPDDTIQYPEQTFIVTVGVLTYPVTIPGFSLPVGCKPTTVTFQNIAKTPCPAAAKSTLGALATDTNGFNLVCPESCIDVTYEGGQGGQASVYNCVLDPIPKVREKRIAIPTSIMNLVDDMDDAESESFWGNFLPSLQGVLQSLLGPAFEDATVDENGFVVLKFKLTGCVLDNGTRRNRTDCGSRMVPTQACTGPTTG